MEDDHRNMTNNFVEIQSQHNVMDFTSMSHPSSLLLSDPTMTYFTIAMNLILQGGASIAGTISNVVNMALFKGLGLKDSMTVGLFALSLADFCIALLQLAMCGCYLTSIVYPTSSVDPLALRYVAFAWTRYVAYLMPCWITVVISLERSFCVIFPFRVRQTFTRPRCVAAVLTICSVLVVIHSPMFTMQYLDWSVIPDTLSPLATHNTSKTRRVLTIRYNDNKEYNHELVINTIDLVLLVLSHAIILTCTLWMIRVLITSSKIRRTSVNIDVAAFSPSKTIFQLHAGWANNKSKIGYLTGREQKLVQIVLFIAIYLTTCNIPNFIAVAVYYTIPGFNDDVRYVNVQAAMWNVGDFFHTLSVSMNCVIYYRLNTSYRCLCKRWLGFGLKSSNIAM